MPSLPCGVRFYWRKIERGQAKGREAERLAVAALVAEAFPARHFTIDHRADGSPFIPGYGGGVSISHSHAYAALAVDPQGRHIGIDVEEASRLGQLQRVAPRFLSDRQLEICLSATPSPLLLTAWTQKEALYKALGLSGVDFRSLPIAPDWGEVDFAGRRFAMFPIPDLPGCLGALAVERP